MFSPSSNCRPQQWRRAWVADQVLSSARPRPHRLQLSHRSCPAPGTSTVATVVGIKAGTASPSRLSPGGTAQTSSSSLQPTPCPGPAQQGSRCRAATARATGQAVIRGRCAASLRALLHYIFIGPPVFQAPAGHVPPSEQRPCTTSSAVSTTRSTFIPSQAATWSHSYRARAAGRALSSAGPRPHRLRPGHRSRLAPGTSNVATVVGIPARWRGRHSRLEPTSGEDRTIARHGRRPATPVEGGGGGSSQHIRK